MINTRNENIYLAGCLTFADVRKHFAYHQGKSAAVCFLIMLLASAICFEMNGPVTGGTWGVRALLNFLAAVILSLAVTVIATAISFFRLYRTYKTNQRLKSARSITIHQLGISQKQKTQAFFLNGMNCSRLGSTKICFDYKHRVTEHFCCRNDFSIRKKISPFSGKCSGKM